MNGTPWADLLTFSGLWVGCSAVLAAGLAWMTARWRRERARSARLARRLAEAEAAAHGSPDASPDGSVLSQHLQAVLDVLPVGVTLSDAEGRVVYANPARRQIWGEGEGRAPFSAQLYRYHYRGWDVDTHRLLTPEEWPMMRALRTGEQVGPIEMLIQLDDGPLKPVLVSGTPLRDGAARLLGGVGILLDLTERKAIENRLRAREQAAEQHLDELDAVYQTAPVGLAFLDADLRYVHVSRVLARWRGSAPEDMVGQTIVDMLPPGEVERLLPYYQRVLGGEVIENVEVQGVAPFDPGTARDWLLNFHPMTDVEGRVRGANVVVQDVTALKQAERQVQEREAQYRALFTSIDEAYALCELVPNDAGEPVDFRFLEVNPRFVNVAGVPDPTGGTAYTLWPELAREWVQTYARMVRENTARRFEGIGLRGQYYDVFATPVEGGPGRFAIVFKDVTAQRQALRALRESEARFRRMADHAPTMVWVTEADGSCSFLSRAWLEFTGQTEATGLGFGWLDAVHPEDASRARAAFLAANERQGGFSLEYRLRRHDGVYRWAIDTAAARFDDGAFQGYVGSVIDITDRKEAEEALRRAKEEAEEASRMKSVFLANMSHEIRTPLTAIIGYAEVIRDELEGEMQRFADTIVRGGKRLTETLSSVLTLAQFEAASVRLSRQPLNLTVETEALVRLYEREARNAGLDLVLNLDPGARSVWALLDAGGFASVLQNLIGNAIKFTPQGRITVRLTREPASAPGHAVLTVEDTGIGIREDFFPHLFEPFQQASSGMARTHEGSGLGLSIARQLVERMGGTIGVESTLGQGSRFTVRFPTVPAPEAPRKALHAAPDRRHRVLVVEDTAETRELLQMLLAPACEVTLVADAAAALEAARAAEAEGQPFEALLADIHLGGAENGMQLLDALRGQEAYRSLPAAAVTAFALPGDAERLLQHGFDAYLRKPFTARELDACLETLLPRD